MYPDEVNGASPCSVPRVRLPGGALTPTTGSLPPVPHLCRTCAPPAPHLCPTCALTCVLNCATVPSSHTATRCPIVTRAAIMPGPPGRPTAPSIRHRALRSHGDTIAIATAHRRHTPAHAGAGR